MNTDISHLELVARACACGCGAVFKCLSTSPQKYWARWHNKEFLNKGLAYDEDFDSKRVSMATLEKINERKKKLKELFSKGREEWAQYIALNKIQNAKRTIRKQKKGAA